MFIGLFCCIIFLFTVYQLAKEDFLFLRRGITLDQVFTVVFVTLPIALFSSRLFYVLLHPSIHFLNPLVFLALPYFPGLSLIGGIVGTWIFVFFYAPREKIPYRRLLDILGIAFLLSLSLGFFVQGIMLFSSQRLVGIEHIGESMLGIAFALYLLTQFLKNAFPEGVTGYLSIVCYCLLSFLSVGFMLLSHTHIVFSSVVLTGMLLGISLLLCMARLRLIQKVLGG